MPAYHLEVYQQAGDMPELRVDVDDCAGLRAAAIARWGAPDVPPATWLDPAHHVQAIVAERDGHGLVTFHRYKTADELAAPGDPDRLGFEPFDVLGRTGAELHEGFQAMDGHDDVAWWAPGVAGDAEYPEIIADVTDGRITSYEVALEGAWLERARLVRALRAKYGAPSGGNQLRWRTPTRSITAYAGSEVLRIVVAAPTESPR